MPTKTKKRILMVNEGGHLHTGYGNYGLEVLTRLYNTDKYEIAEFSSFTTIEQARDNKAICPWKIYANAVHKDDPRYEQMKARGDCSFGSWRFERVVLDFKPDIVFDIRDYWMLAFENDSPLREYFHWSIMPTVDSSPQNESWLETFIQADSVFTYSDWGKEVLEDEGGGKIETCGVASPGVDLNVFTPTKDKNVHRDSMGLSGDLNIVGTVMRNQKRKLYPELFEAFANYIEKCIKEGREDLAKKSYLYVHTSYPDSGWEIPQLLARYGLSHKALFTYLCGNCGYYFSSFFQDARTVCKKCSHTSAMLPNSAKGLTRKQLADVYNLFDAYVQYSICEGFGMPQVEAIACGVPIFTVGYSAMTEIGVKSGGFVVPPKTKFLELETGAYRVYPDNDYLVDSLFNFFIKPLPARAKFNFQARQTAEKFYDWDVTAKIWENHFDSIELTGNQGKWDTKVSIHEPAESIPPQHENWNNEDFVEWLILDVLGRPDLINGHYSMEAYRSLHYGIRKVGEEYVNITRQDLFNAAKAKAKLKALAEKARMGMVTVLKEDFIEAANE